MLVVQMCCLIDIAMVDGDVGLLDGTERLMSEEVAFEIAPGAMAGHAG
jgi:hypothetical protein